MYDVIIKKFTFAVSSSDEFLFIYVSGQTHRSVDLQTH